jgi:hypothetical protein
MGRAYGDGMQRCGGFPITGQPQPPTSNSTRTSGCMVRAGPRGVIDPD